MRSLVIAAAILGLFATTVRAADDTSAIVGTFPDTEDNLKVVLFTLKENKIPLSISPQEFCAKMHYGEAVYGERAKDIGKDDKVSPGDLVWVICRYKGK